MRYVLVICCCAEKSPIADAHAAKSRAANICFLRETILHSRLYLASLKCGIPRESDASAFERISFIGIANPPHTYDYC